MSKELQIGEKIDLTALDPTLMKIIVIAGWESEKDDEKNDLVDVDLSLFLLNRADMTREDSDFVFYNNPAGEAGAVSHTGQQKTGATGDDKETIIVDLNGLQFDIEKITIVLSVYGSEDKGTSFAQVKNRYLKIVNRDTSTDMLHVNIPDDDKTTIGTKVGMLERDGVNWHFTAMNEPVKGGLTKIAQEYGMLIQGS